MKREILVLAITILAISIRIVNAQKTTSELTDHFFKTYETSPEKAVEYIFGTNKWMIERNKDGVENMKNKLTGLIELIGEYYGYEKITEKSIGESFKIITYMIKYDRQPLRFTFIFYKPNDKWQIQNFQYDDNLDEELEESGKIYRLK